MQRWWIAVAGVVGVGLAVLLMPRPDTGADVPDRTPVVDPVATGAVPNIDDASPGAPRSGPEADLAPNHDPAPIGSVATDADDKPRMSPAAERVAKMRNTPEAATAAQVSAPWTLVRQAIQKSSSDAEAQALAQEVDVLVNEIRDMRRDPQSFDWAELEVRQQELARRVRGSRYANGEVVGALDAIDARLREYHDRPANPVQ